MTKKVRLLLLGLVSLTLLTSCGSSNSSSKSSCGQTCKVGDLEYKEENPNQVLHY